MVDRGYHVFALYLLAPTSEPVEVEIALYIDEKDWTFRGRTVPGEKITSVHHRLAADDGARFLNDLRKGNSASALTSSGEAVTWSLRGANAAITRMERCYGEIALGTSPLPMR
jgi:hypothetical protein